ncbi:hypothetical protein EBZ80_13440 [bacterium]|nr:hypothetical protein [bacterium]
MAGHLLRSFGAGSAWTAGGSRQGRPDVSPNSILYDGESSVSVSCLPCSDLDSSRILPVLAGALTRGFLRNSLAVAQERLRRLLAGL